MRVPTTLGVILLLLATAHLTASGPLGIYGIVEKVVFEPNAQSPERVQVWGAFAYVDGGTAGARGVSAATRGYLYFKLPALVPGFTSQSKVDIVKTEWADLQTIAGTGQAIGFGQWGYVGAFTGLQPEARAGRTPYILENVAANRGAPTDLRVRPASEAPASPATYQTNAGIVKLTDRGSHAAIVQELKEALKR